MKHSIENPNPNSVAGIFYRSWLTSPSTFMNPRIQVRETFKNGWGVIATENIAENDLIEFSLGMNLEIRENAQKDPILHKYFWKNRIGDKPACYCKECKEAGSLFYIFGGNINSYNIVLKKEFSNINFVVIENAHKNISWKDNYPPTFCHLGIVYANKPIKAGEELLVYGGDRYEGQNKKTPHVDSNSTLKPPAVKLWVDNLGETNGQITQPDGSSLIPVGFRPEAFTDILKESNNDGSIPENLNLEKLLEGGLNRVDVNK
jgi:hypothetical protein